MAREPSPPLSEALLARNAATGFAQADETRWMAFVAQDGKVGDRWWLWVFLGEDTVAFRLDPTRPGATTCPRGIPRRTPRWC
jgi:transposase